MFQSVWQKKTAANTANLGFKSDRKSGTDLVILGQEYKNEPYKTNPITVEIDIGAPVIHKPFGSVGIGAVVVCHLRTSVE
ncbi:hypothetical protein N9D31_01600 [Oligoflexaceae bacterium]|nr:hypothetical protein [Oligoflexaceae bacterium]